LFFLMPNNENVNHGNSWRPDISRLINSFYRKYIVTEFIKSVLTQASTLRGRYHLSFWDSLIIASALSVSASKLLSEDMQHGMTIDGQLTIINPFLSLSTS